MSDQQDLSTAFGVRSKFVVASIKSTCSRRYHGGPLWVLIRDAVGYGSTTSSEICRRAGFNPNQILSTKPLKPIAE